jgi:hypothetical protein
MYFVNFAPLRYILMCGAVFGAIPSLGAMVSLLDIPSYLRFP